MQGDDCAIRSTLDQRLRVGRRGHGSGFSPHPRLAGAVVGFPRWAERARTLRKFPPLYPYSYLSSSSYHPDGHHKSRPLLRGRVPFGHLSITLPPRTVTVAGAGVAASRWRRGVRLAAPAPRIGPTHVTWRPRFQRTLSGLAATMPNGGGGGTQLEGPLECPEQEH
jgi:hypothetical protein